MQHSIIQTSQLEGAHRLDAEYYQPEYLEKEKKLENTLTITLGEIAYVTDGEHGSPIWDENSGIKYFSSQYVEEGSLRFEGINYIDVKIHEKNKRTQLKEGDILLSIVGRIGVAGLVGQKDLPANTDRNVATIKITNKEFLPEFITVFLNSKYGKFQTLREVAGNVQPIIILSKVRNLLIPKFSNQIQKQVSLLLQECFVEQSRSDSLYQQAEKLLLEKLGLADFKPRGDLSFVVNFSDVKEVKRADADFFQPKYETLISKIKSQKTKQLKQFIASYSTGFPFRSDNYAEQGMPLIRINNIKKGYLDLSDTAFLTERDFKLSPQDTARAGDIVLSMSGSIGITAVIPEDVPTCSVNQRILKFTPKDVDADYLSLLLNSIIGVYQLERIGTGGVQTNISYKDIQNILIPDLPISTQRKIADLVRRSHEARKKSKELLEEAKRKVEEMIEKGNSES